jgi:hypothetical protein
MTEFFKGEVPLMSAPDFQPAPAPGSVWQHRNGNIYYVVSVTNLLDVERYPKTVVYQGANGRLWSRPADDWHRSFTPIGVSKNLLLENLLLENLLLVENLLLENSRLTQQFNDIITDLPNAKG